MNWRKGRNKEAEKNRELRKIEKDREAEEYKYSKRG
jgi:hypothetical protein